MKDFTDSVFAVAAYWFICLSEGKSMKNLTALALGTVPLLATGVSFAQSGNMMNGGMWGGGWMGGYGGMWMPILFLVVLVGLVVWIVKQKDK